MTTSLRGRGVRLAVAVSAVSLMFGLASCASSDPQVPVPEEARSALTALTSQPVDLSIAHTTAWRSCMQTAGFQVPFDSTAGGQRRSALIGVEGLFASEDDARAFGYSSTTGEGEGTLDRFRSSLPPSQQEQYDLAHFGSGETVQVSLPNGLVVSRSADGCIAEGDKAVYGSVENAIQVGEFVNEVNTESSQFLDEAESSLREVLGTYEDCMSAQGVSVSGLSAGEVAASQFGQYRAYDEAPSADEQALAVTDFSCQVEAGFNEKLDDVFVQNASVWIVENEDRIIALRDLLDESMVRSQQVIDGV